jgi:hypothetical protein
MVKKRLIIMLLLVTMILLSAACNSNTPATPGGAEKTEEQQKKDGPKDQAENKPTYKETMLPFDQLVSAQRIVLLQNTINFSRPGFYNVENKPATEDIAYNGTTVAAYPMSYPLAFLTNGSTGDFTVTNNDGSSRTITAQDFAGLYVIIDFTSDAPPVLYNPVSGTEIKDFLFATTAEGEAIYSIVSSSIHNAAKIIENVGWDTEVPYRYVASDKFYIPVEPNENATGEIRGTLSGAINGSFPELAIAGGKINDVVYIEVMK